MPRVGGGGVTLKVQFWTIWPYNALIMSSGEQPVKLDKMRWGGGGEDIVAGANSPSLHANDSFSQSLQSDNDYSLPSSEVIKHETSV